MPKKGIHPVLRTVTYVLKNGASVEVPSVQQRTVPYTLQQVIVVCDLLCWFVDHGLSSACVQSVTHHLRSAPAGYNDQSLVDWREEDRFQRRTVSENDA